MEEKLVFLKREEVKTMAKDVARLQEEAAQKEKERIVHSQTEEKLQKEALERQKIAGTMIPKPGNTAKAEANLLPEKVSQPSALEKILVRLALTLLVVGLLLFLGFIYWYVRVRPGPAPSPSTPSTPLGTSPLRTFSPTPEASASPSTTPTPVVPTALFPVEETKILKTDSEKGLLQLLEQTLLDPGEPLAQAQFFQLAGQKGDQFLNARSFLSEAGLTLSEDVKSTFLEKPEDFTFFLYVKAGEPRWGFVVRVTSIAQASQKMAEQEAGLAQAFSPLLKALGQKDDETSLSFQSARYRQVAFRYASLSEKNLGLCWATTRDYLILTSSGESLMEVINRLLSNQPPI